MINLYSDISRKQQNSDKLIQILKRKLEIVTEKYDQMKKQFSKEKFIGLPSNHKSSENNSFGDLSGLLDSPTKTPRKDIGAKIPTTGFSLISLKERREMKKVQGVNNSIKNNNANDYSLDKFSAQNTESPVEEFALGEEQKRPDSFHNERQRTKTASSLSGILLSARSGVGLREKNFKSIK